MDPSDTRFLHELLDKQAITERLYDYARAMDRLDAELGRACFQPDAPVDYGAQMYQGMAAHPTFHSHSHQFSKAPGKRTTRVSTR